jgi:two-component system, NarL family, capsular synthesis sensor histidine kinase RcsC
MNYQPIIFVDDDAMYLQLVESIVAKKGVKAHYATSGEHALELMQSARCETMITDLNMPGMDGYKLARLAKDLFPELRIIMVTGEISTVVSRRAAEAGISRVIGKPTCADQVGEILQHAAARFAA